jgi:hypothetical protein
MAQISVKTKEKPEKNTHLDLKRAIAQKKSTIKFASN